jgi:cob(I)alamin adenosyltransferase
MLRFAIRKMSDTLPKSKIYTKTGDKGTSSLYNGSRVPKSDFVFEALGNTDELNAHIGLAREYCLNESNTLDEKLAEIQSRLMDVGSHVATPLKSSASSKIQRTAFAEDHIQYLENWIDEMDNQLPPLKNFILPVKN